MTCQKAIREQGCSNPNQSKLKPQTDPKKLKTAQNQIILDVFGLTFYENRSDWIGVWIEFWMCYTHCLFSAFKSTHRIKCYSISF
jgi:hypothetical protein